MRSVHRRLVTCVPFVRVNARCGRVWKKADIDRVVLGKSGTGASVDSEVDSAVGGTRKIARKCGSRVRPVQATLAALSNVAEVRSPASYRVCGKPGIAQVPLLL